MSLLPFSVPRVLPLMAGLCLAAPAAAQTTVSFQDGAQPSASYAGSSDTYISQANPDTNYAGQATLLVDGDEPAGSAQDLVMLLRWDVSAIPSTATVQSAELVFNVVNSSTQAYGIFEVKRAWSSGQATWNQAASDTPWGSPGAAGSGDRGTTELGSLAPSATGSYTVALNSAGVRVVQGWVATPSSNHGLLVADATKNDGVDVRSGNDATASLRPRLRVTYTTATPPPPGTAVLIAAGDIAEAVSGSERNGAAITANLVEGLLADNPGARVAALGDLVYPGGEMPGTNLFTTLYAPTWGRFKSVTLPVIGNHEYHDGSSWAVPPDNYANYFGAAAGPRGLYYYAHDLGPWKVLVLNSNCAGENADQRCSHTDQMTWLKSQLQAATNKCVMAVFHHPLYGTQSYSTNPYMVNRLKEYWQVLYDANADLILAGHAHTYERLKPLRPDGTVDTTRGIREFIVGSGGAHLGGGSMNSRHDKFIDDTYGVLKLTLRDTGYDWRFYPESLFPTATDSGSGSCH